MAKTRNQPRDKIIHKARETGVCCALALLSVANVVDGAAGDPSRGAKAFQQCTACHSIQPGEHLTGPSLAHVWGQKAGTQKDFVRYSEALKKSDVTWNEKTLDRWLTNPQELIPGR